MSEEEVTLKTWEQVIVDFLTGKAEVDEEKYLKEALKSVGEQYKKIQFFNDDTIEYLFDTRKNKKEKNETSLNFHRKRALQALALTNKPEGLNTYTKKKEYFKTIKELTIKYSPQSWLL